MAHPWPMFAPEGTYYSMVSGAGPAPMLAYGDVLVAQAASMASVWAQCSTYVFGSKEPCQGRLIEHAVFVESVVAL